MLDVVPIKVLELIVQKVQSPPLVYAKQFSDASRSIPKRL